MDRVPQGTREDARRALDAAADAQAAWEDVLASERAKPVLRWAELIEENLEAIAQVVTAEEGKPLKEARDDVNGVAAYARYYASLARQIEGEVLPAESKDRTIMILRVPVGVVVQGRGSRPSVQIGGTRGIMQGESLTFVRIRFAQLAAIISLPAGNEEKKEKGESKLITRVRSTPSRLRGSRQLAHQAVPPMCQSRRQQATPQGS